MPAKKKTRRPYGSVKAAREAVKAAAAAPKQDFDRAIAMLQNGVSDTEYNLKSYADRRDEYQKHVDHHEARREQLLAAIALLKANSATPQD